MQIDVYEFHGMNGCDLSGCDLEKHQGLELFDADIAGANRLSVSGRSFGKLAAEDHHRMQQNAREDLLWIVEGATPDDISTLIEFDDNTDGSVSWWLFEALSDADQAFGHSGICDVKFHFTRISCSVVIIDGVVFVPAETRDGRAVMIPLVDPLEWDEQESWDIDDPEGLSWGMDGLAAPGVLGRYEHYSEIADVMTLSEADESDPS